MKNNSFCDRNHAWGWSGDRVMTIFGKFFMCKNGFSLITHLFKTIQTSSPVATHTKSGMPRRSKGSKHDFKIFIFPGPIFFRSRLFVVSVFLSGPFFSPVLKVLSFKTLTDRRGLKNPIQRTTFYLQRSSGARVMVGFVSFFLPHLFQECLASMYTNGYTK